MDIQWYPGHMARAKRLLQQQLSKADIAVELCDARIPLSSRNPDLNRLLREKRRILLLCKADLADGGATSRWIQYFAGRRDSSGGLRRDAAEDQARAGADGSGRQGVLRAQRAPRH